MSAWLNYLNQAMGRAQARAGREQFQGLLGQSPTVETQPMAGPMMPGQARPDVTAQVAGTGQGLLGGQMAMPEFYAKAASIPGYEQFGMQGLMKSMEGTGAAGYKNVTQDDLGNWFGLNPSTGMVEQIPVGGQFTKYKTVQSVDPSGRTSIELVSPGLLQKGGQGRITIGKKGFSEGQTTAAGFADRMTGASDIITGLEGQGFDPANISDFMAGKIPIAGNYMLSNQARLYRQAQEDWVRAKLRKESGAVIGEQEMSDEIKTYFPQPGDSKAVINQKAKARATATRGMINQSQGAYEAMQSPIVNFEDLK